MLIAYQNSQEPLKRRLTLHDGGLELSEIIKRQLLETDLTYLSACQTSTGDDSPMKSFRNKLFILLPALGSSILVLCGSRELEPMPVARKIR